MFGIVTRDLQTGMHNQRKDQTAMSFMSKEILSNTHKQLELISPWKWNQIHIERFFSLSLSSRKKHTHNNQDWIQSHTISQFICGTFLIRSTISCFFLPSCCLFHRHRNLPFSSLFDFFSLPWCRFVNCTI